MKTSSYLSLFLVVFFSLSAFAQNGSIKGVVKDAISNEPLSFALISIQSTTIGVKTGIDGDFELKDLFRIQEESDF
jgi:hypothetical protein